MFEGLFQPMHLLVIFFIALLVFGPKKLPELGKGIGEGIRALKDGMKEGSVGARGERAAPKSRTLHRPIFPTGPANFQPASSVIGIA